jgi:hypothetical protein
LRAPSCQRRRLSGHGRTQGDAPTLFPKGDFNKTTRYYKTHLRIITHQRL